MLLTRKTASLISFSKAMLRTYLVHLVPTEGLLMHKSKTGSPHTEDCRKLAQGACGDKGWIPWRSMCQQMVSNCFKLLIPETRTWSVGSGDWFFKSALPPWDGEGGGRRFKREGT